MTEETRADYNIHKDHRKKVREKFYECGFQGMAPHNILEMLLFFGIPYKDTNKIAHDLIDYFGSISAVFEAKRTDLMKIKGMTENAACLITMVLPLYKKYSEDLLSRTKKFEKLEQTVAFLRNLYLDNNNSERVYVLCFDTNNTLLTYRLLSEGDLVSSNIDMRKLASTVLETNAASVIISHNHPHGIATPSSNDIDATKAVCEMLSSLKVKLADHIIVTDANHFSMVNSPRFVHIFYNLPSAFE